MVEIIAVIFSLISVILTIKRSVWCWGVGIVGIIAYFVCFYQTQLYAQMCLQLVFITQAIIGWVNWSKDADINSKIVNIKSQSNYQIVMFTIFTLLVCSGIYLTADLNKDKGIIIMDSASTILAIIANYLITQRKIDGWYFWILCDIVMIFLFLKIGLVLSSVLYFVFMCLSIIGLFTWNKNIKTV